MLIGHFYALSRLEITFIIICKATECDSMNVWSVRDDGKMQSAVSARAAVTPQTAVAGAVQ